MSIRCLAPTVATCCRISAKRTNASDRLDLRSLPGALGAARMFGRGIRWSG
jgi:hypothetical protein